MQVNGAGPIYRVHGPQDVGGPHRAAKGADAAQPTDKLDISPAAQEAARLAEAAEARAAAKADEPIRADVVARVRQEIADGSYETPEKLEEAIDRLLGELG